jgi:hypothetical protein
MLIKNTRDFVNFIKATLPEAKLISEALAEHGLHLSVFR